MEQHETLPLPSEGYSAKEIIKAMIKEAEMLGLPIRLPVSPELEIELISGGSHEVMKLSLNGRLAVTLTEDESKGGRYNEVIFTGRNKDGKDVEVRYDQAGSRKDSKITVFKQQAEPQPGQPGRFKYPEDFPERIELVKVVKELKENFRTRTSPKTDILSRASKSKTEGSAIVARKAA